METAELTSEELLPIALSFYELQHTHIIHEDDPDTRVNCQTILIFSIDRECCDCMALFDWPCWL